VGKLPWQCSCSDLAGPSKAGRLRRLELPHFRGKFVITGITRVHSLLSGARPRYHWVYLAAAGLLNWVSPLLRLYSSRLPVPAIGDKAHQPSASAFCSVIFERRAGGEAIVSAAVATVDRAWDRWLQIVWKRRFLESATRAHPDNWKWRWIFFFPRFARNDRPYAPLSRRRQRHPSQLSAAPPLGSFRRPCLVNAPRIVSKEIWASCLAGVLCNQSLISN